MKFKICFIITLCLLTGSLLAQVEGPERIIGKYEGSQKKGLAHGKGKSTGTDVYEGNFKKGFPEGKGKYYFKKEVELEGFLFKPGDIYEGEFKKGMFEGHGKLILNSDSGKIVEGYWSGNRYIGLTENGYEVIIKNNIARVECRYDGSAKNDINITGLDDIVEVGQSNIEYNGRSQYYDIPAEKFPFYLHIKGTVPSTGAKAELRVMLEKPGIWTIIITTDAI